MRPTTPAPVVGTLAPPADLAGVLQPDAGSGLAALGFPGGWPLPADAADIVGVTARYSVGDSVYATFRTAYTVEGTDHDAVLEEWRLVASKAFGIDIDPFFNHASSAVGESWGVSSLGSAEAGAPSLDVEVAQAAGETGLQVIIEYQTLDLAFPAIDFPLIDPAMPTMEGCEVRRIDVDLDGFIDVTTSPEPAVYRLRWEGQCADDSFDAAAEWALSHDLFVADGTTSFGQTATLADGTTVQVDVSKLDDGGVFLGVITEQPIA